MQIKRSTLRAQALDEEIRRDLCAAGMHKTTVSKVLQKARAELGEDEPSVVPNIEEVLARQRGGCSEEET